MAALRVHPWYLLSSEYLCLDVLVAREMVHGQKASRAVPVSMY